MKKLIFLGLMWGLVVYGKEIKDQKECFDLASLIKTDTITEHISYKKDITSFSGNYKKFASGVGGAFVAGDGASKKVIKIFPSVGVSDNKYNYRELFYTCLNTFIKYSDIGIGSQKNAFPKLYEVGITNAASLDSKAEKFLYPYMIFEYIDGDSLASIATKKQLQKSDYDAVLYELIHILYGMKNLKINNKSYEFYHGDLNPGNIFIRNEKFSGKVGSQNLSNAPLVTLIDFGHSTSAFDSLLGSKVTSIKTLYHKSLAFSSNSMKKLYSDLGSTPPSGFEGFFRLFTQSNSDIRYFTMLAEAIYKSNNFQNEFLIKYFKGCPNRTQCFNLLPPLK